LRKDSNAPQRERVSEWKRWYEASSPGYQMNALLAILKNDGEQMLSAVLRELGLATATDLVKDAAKRDL
jgi:hypothetical protein